MKRIITYGKIIIATFCIGALFVGTWKILRFLVIDDTTSYTRVMMHEFYNQDNIDVLFSGASLCYRAFDINVLDNELGLNTFNAGSSSQDLDATYILIKEAINEYDLKDIYLELSPIMALNIDIEERNSNNLTGTYIISDYLRTSFSKIRFLLTAMQPESYVNGFLVARRNWEKVFDGEYVSDLVKKKQSKEYKTFSYENLNSENEYYVGKGYIACETQIEEHYFYDNYGYEPLDINKINSEWFDYLTKIIVLCKKNDVDITLICSPLSSHLLTSLENYDEYSNMVKQIALEEGVDFYDFNLCKEQFFKNKSEYYMDSAHLNKYGAEAFSKLLADVITGNLNYSEICYNSVGEKLEEIGPAVSGITYDSNDMRVVANQSDCYEFMITQVSKEGEVHVIQNYSSYKSFSVNREEHGTIKIDVRRIDGIEEALQLEYLY